MEREKLAAIGARNLLQTYAKRREAETQQLTALIREKQAEADRLYVQYVSLAKMEAQQQEFIDQFILHK